MVLAYTANDLQQMSKGRFILGLGSQIKPHIEKRFSMPWSHPARRMREYILALHAIWDVVERPGQPLKFDGEFYRHTLMTPFFAPPPNPYGAPKVFLAAVGEMMTEVAGEVADGIIIHGFTTERYVKEVTVPAIERGLEGVGPRPGVVPDLGPAVRRHRHERRRRSRRPTQGVKQQIAFYGSTPAYRGVLELHGWGDLQTELNALSKQGEWVKMGELIDDDILRTFAVVAEPEGVGAELKRRYGGVVDRCSFYAPYRTDPDRWENVIADLKTRVILGSLTSPTGYSRARDSLGAQVGADGVAHGRAGGDERDEVGEHEQAECGRGDGEGRYDGIGRDVEAARRPRSSPAGPR